MQINAIHTRNVYKMFKENAFYLSTLECHISQNIERVLHYYKGKAIIYDFLPSNLILYFILPYAFLGLSR